MQASQYGKKSKSSPEGLIDTQTRKGHTAGVDKGHLAEIVEPQYLHGSKQQLLLVYRTIQGVNVILQLMFPSVAQ